METVVVAMSGGVDSSVSALLLKQKGYRVIGMFMKNWDEGDNCLAEKDYVDVQRVAESLDIPYYTVNFTKEYWDNVFQDFLADYDSGITPNPDVLCNREIKFKALLNKAVELGGDFLATGHYTQVGGTKDHPLLLRGNDQNKDQSYFLCNVTEKSLKKTLFPIGHLPKRQVRELAKKYHLSTSDKKDSTGICFIGKRNFRQFLSQYIQGEPGEFQTPEGKIVGKHIGLPFYTIGQRRGLGIGGPGEAWYVVDKKQDENIVIVVQGDNHPKLFSSNLVADSLSWISGEAPKTPFSCTAKVRYRQTDRPCVIESIVDGKAYVTFLKPERAITPGQYVVFYNAEVCLGGGRIKTSGRSRS